MPSAAAACRAVGVGHEEVGPCGGVLQVFEIAHESPSATAGRRGRACAWRRWPPGFAAHPVQESGQPLEVVGLQCQGDLLVTELVVAVHHGVQERLPRGAPLFLGYRATQGAESATTKRRPPPSP